MSQQHHSVPSLQSRPAGGLESAVSLYSLNRLGVLQLLSNRLFSGYRRAVTTCGCMPAPFKACTRFLKKSWSVHIFSLNGSRHALVFWCVCKAVVQHCQLERQQQACQQLSQEMQQRRSDSAAAESASVQY